MLNILRSLDWLDYIFLFNKYLSNCLAAWLELGDFSFEIQYLQIRYPITLYEEFVVLYLPKPQWLRASVTH